MSPSANFTPEVDTSRISISALYTGHVWFRHGLSLPELYSFKGKLSYGALAPVNALIRAVAGADIETFLLERHLIIDELLSRAIEQQGVCQVIEIAAGMSPRGACFMRKYGDSLRYIEADLPDMAARKRRYLSQHDLLSDRHQVAECNILAQEGADSLSALFSNLDTSKPVLVITEGLVNYFELPVITDFWKRLADNLVTFPKGIYLTEIYPDLQEHPLYRWVQFAQKVVGLLTRGGYPLHYRNDQDIEAGFSDCGFADIKVHNPASYYDSLPLKRLEMPSAVRIVEAAV